MGLGLVVIECVGGGMAGIGANVVVQGIMAEYGYKYASKPITKACVACASWAVGCYASKKVSKMFVDEVDDVAESVKSLRASYKKFKANRNKTEEVESDDEHERPWEDEEEYEEEEEVDDDGDE